MQDLLKVKPADMTCVGLGNTGRTKGALP